jgi:autotransporter-associated beta strand protein
MKTQKSPLSKIEAGSTHRRSPVAKPIRLLARIAAVWLVWLAGAAVSRAASGAWTGATDAFWTNALNWSASPAPGTGDTATFNGASANTTVDLLNGVTVGNILFDTASVAPYTIGAGGAGQQTLTLDVNGGVTLSPTVAANQVLNANLALPAIGFYNIVNNSANTLTLAGTNSSASSGSAVLTVDGTGATAITGPIAAGAGSMGLQKTNSGTLLLSGGGYFSATNVNSYLPGVNYDPVDLRSGTTIISSGVYTNIGEFTVGGVIADGGPGNNVNLTMNGGSLAVSTWFSLGRGNGIGGVSSDLVLNNNASITAGNISCGYNVNSTNQPKGTVTLNNASSLNISGNGAVNFAESAGSDFTLTLNGTSQFIGPGTGTKSLGYSGTGTVTLNDSSAIHFGNGICYVGHNYGTGAVTVASANAVFENAGELRIGGSDSSGTGRNANGTFTVNGGTVNLGALTIGRGNNNQNGCNGVLYINDGTVTSTNDVLLAFAGATNDTGSIAMNGGTLNVGTTVTKWLRFGQWDFTSGEIDITNGNLNLNSGTSIKFDQNNSSGPKTFNQYGGNVTFYSDFATTVGGGGNLDLMLSGVATSSNTYNLNGGTLTVPQVTSSSGNGTRIFNFNGGTLRPTASSTTFFNLGSGTTAANVRDGGAIIDCNGYDITIAQPLVHSTIAGDAAIDGGLTKLGAGTLMFSNTPTYTGPTRVLGGGLVLSTAGGPVGTAAADFVVSNATVTVDASSGVAAILANNFTAAATLNLSQNPITNVIVAAGNLSLSNNTVINVAYGALNGNPALPAIKAAGSLTAGNNITVNVSAIGLRSGTIPLITVGSGMNASDFVLGTLPPGVVGSLSASGATLNLVISFANKQLTWQGENGTNWDTTTVNWTNNADGTPATYTEYSSPEVGDGVVFNDTVTNDFVNPQPTNVNITAEFRPVPVTVDSTLPFSLSGPGGITGVSSIVKNNTGSLTLLTSNSFSGGVVINGGALIVTNDDALGANVSVVTFNGGTLQVNGSTTNNSRALTMAGAGTIGVPTNAVVQFGGGVSGGGGLTKVDNGTLNLAGNNTYAGPTVVNAGTLNLAGTVTNASATVGNSSGNAVMGISGTLITKNLFVGNVSGADGAVYQNGGTVTASGGTGDNLSIGNWSGSFGYYKATGGTINVNGINIGGEQNPNVWPPAGSGDGIMEVNGATINNIGWIVLARGGGPNMGVLSIAARSPTVVAASAAIGS